MDTHTHSDITDFLSGIAIPDDVLGVPRMLTRHITYCNEHVGGVDAEDIIRRIDARVNQYIQTSDEISEEVYQEMCAEMVDYWKAYCSSIASTIISGATLRDRCRVSTDLNAHQMSRARRISTDTRYQAYLQRDCREIQYLHDLAYPTNMAEITAQYDLSEDRAYVAYLVRLATDPQILQELAEKVLLGYTLSFHHETGEIQMTPPASEEPWIFLHGIVMEMLEEAMA